MNKFDAETKRIHKEIDKFRKSGNIQKAIEACRGAISQDENNAELHIKLGDLYMEWHLDIHQVQQYTEEAITEYQRALESCVDSAEIYYKIAMAFYYKRELDKAINYFKIALEHNTKMAEAHFMIAEIFMRKGDFIEAVEYAQRAISIAPFSSSRAYFLIFNIMSLSNKTKWYKKYSKLLASFLTLPFDKHAVKSVIKHLSYLQFVPVLLKTSFMIFLKGFNQKVLDTYIETIDKAPGFVELYINLGRVYYELKRYDDAICEYKMAIWLDSLNLRAYYYLCQLYEEQRDFDNAIETCKRLIELQPHVADFHCRIAQYLYLNPSRSSPQSRLVMISSSNCRSISKTAPVAVSAWISAPRRRRKARKLLPGLPSKQNALPAKMQTKSSSMQLRTTLWARTPSPRSRALCSASPSSNSPVPAQVAVKLRTSN